MATTWILVADRSHARVYEQRSPATPVRLLRSIPHPEGRKPNRAFDSDKAGASFDSTGNSRHAMIREHSPREHVSAQFAKQLAELLYDGRSQNRYDRLVLVAEPGFLGEIKGTLDKNTLSLVSACVDKDLAWVEDAEVGRYLDGVL